MCRIFTGGSYNIPANFLVGKVTIVCVKYEIWALWFPYGYPDGVALREGVSLREGVAFLRDEELLVVELGVDEEEDPLTLSFLNTNELN